MTSLHAFPPGAVSPTPSEVSALPVIPPSGGASSPANPSGNSLSRRSWREWLPSSLHLRSPKTGTSKSKNEIEWEHTRARIGETVSLLIEAAGEHTPAETSPVVSIPGFLAAVKVLDNILNSVDGVQTNRWACLRLTERCANMLLAIHETLLESGFQVAQELTPALNRIGRCFWDFEHFLKEQAQISFLFQYLRKDEILREIGRHDTAVGDCIALFHGAMPRILKGMLKTSAQPTSLLLATDPNPPSHVSNETLEPLDLAQLESEFLANGLPRDETSSLHETLRLVQDKENATDRARDMEDLGRVLHRALNATSHLAVTRILQIAKPDMPAAIMVLLRELELQQQSGNTGRAAESPSPRVRALTWPLDGVPAKQVSLLHMQFLELDLEAFKKTRQNSEMDMDVNVADSPSPLISGTVRRRAGSYTGARLRVPCGCSTLVDFSSTDQKLQRGATYRRAKIRALRWIRLSRAIMASFSLLSLQVSSWTRN
ncbi:hypothetical protein B0H11DRAFT_1364697 [Mycena galericulata]|nr:hypothetical protein B0H11DRAFT_1364697 [Mycena galericulata]